MKITYDKIADAMYFYLKEGKIFKTVPITDHLIVDFDQNGDTVGIEILNASSEQGSELEKNIRKGVPIEILTGKAVAA